MVENKDPSTTSHALEKSVKSPFVADMVRGWATGMLVGTLFYLGLVWPLFGVSGVVSDASALVVLAVISPILEFLVIAAFFPRAVSANGASFAIIRYSIRGSGLEIHAWSELEAGSHSTWTPISGRRYPIRVSKAANGGMSGYPLTREQVEALAEFPGGAPLRRLFS